MAPVHVAHTEHAGGSCVDAYDTLGTHGGHVFVPVTLEAVPAGHGEHVADPLLEE